MRSMNRWAKEVFLTALVFSAGAPVRAWGPVGHAVTGLIAQDRLSPQAAAAINKLMGANVTLDQLADCADDIRSAQSPVKCGPLTVQPNSASAPWHFINIPIADSPGAGDLENYCSGSCVVDAINSDVATLKNSSAKLLDRQMALIYLSHFVGDEHQPLHCSYQMYKGANDRGGNAEVVSYHGASMKLHYIWDDLVETQAEVASTDPSSLAKTLESQIDQQDASAWTQGDMNASAALESFGIAKETIYPDFNGSGGIMSADYQTRMQPIAYQRLEMAGVRLAAILNQAFQSTGPAASEAASGPSAPPAPRVDVPKLLDSYAQQARALASGKL